MLNEPQIQSIFSDVLQFPDWKEKKDTEILSFLRELLQRYQFYCYFHNTEMSATPPAERRPPVKEDSIRIGLAGSGGVCIHQNYFLTLILQSIGLDAYVSSGTCVGAPPSAADEGNHAMCILKLSETETYALDVGCGQAVDEPIPLHQLPYFGKAAAARYEYRYNPDEKRYERWQYDGTYFKGPFEDPNHSILRYRFDLTPKPFEYFTKTLVDIFTNPDESIFLQSPFLFRALDLDSTAGVNGRRFVLVFGASMVIYDNENREVTNFQTYKEMDETILKYFPKVKPELLAEALDYFTSISKDELIVGRSV